MPATYERHGIRFLYPENWLLKDPSGGESPSQVSLETPEGGIWTLSLFPVGDDPETVLRGAMTALEDQFEDVEWSALADLPAAFPARGQEANFFCLDFVVTAQLLAITTTRHQLLIWFQAESRDFDKQRDVFRAVMASLLQSCEAPPAEA